jgi:hypothetical protein
MCSHALQWFDNASHRPFSQRGVSCQLRIEVLARQDASQQPHRRSRIACIERPSGGSEAIDARAGNRNVAPAVSAALFHVDTQSCQTVKRALAIRGGGIMADFALPSCQRSQDRVTMRDRFISGNLNRPANRMARLDSSFRHGWILTCCRNTLSRHGSPRFPLVCWN